MESLIGTVRNMILSKEDDRVLVYFGIGSAQNFGYHNDQQMPAFLEPIKRDHTVLVLVDPLLESPPYVCCEQPLRYDTSNTNVVESRIEWVWNDRTVQLLEQLVGCSPTVKVLVQDYTGADIARYYPFRGSHPRLLFDATYGTPGCWVDSSSVRILFDAKGGFLCPLLMTLKELTAWPEILWREAEKRRYIANQFLWPLYMVQRGLMKVKPWYAEDYVLSNSWQLLRLYHSDEATNLYAGILERFLVDLGAQEDEAAQVVGRDDGTFRRLTTAYCAALRPAAK